MSVSRYSEKNTNSCDVPAFLSIWNILPTSTDLQLKAHLTRTINLSSCFRKHHARDLRKECHSPPHTGNYHLLLAFSTAPANFIWCSSVLFLQKTQTTALTFCPTVFYEPQLSDLQGWSLVNVAVPYMIVVVLHLDGPYFFLCVFSNPNVCYHRPRGRRQIAHNLQDVGILKMHVHGRIILVSFPLVSFSFPLMPQHLLLSLPPTPTDH